MQFIQRLLTLAFHPCRMILCLCVFATLGQAQSIDISAPSPVRTNDVVGTIVARDLGDARLTDHFFAFIGTPGDLLITIESRNLNGDIDVFTAGSLRPLMRFAVYAESSAPITKSVFLRKREDLILRVEARTPNDDEGSYRVRFSGSFEPIAGGALLAEGEIPSSDATTPTARAGDKKLRRVSSVGARIEEPVTEVAAAPTPEPTPEPTAAASPEAEKTSAAAEETTPRTTAPRNPRSSRSSSRRSAASRRAERAKEIEAERAKEVEAGGDVENKSAESEARPSGRRSATRKSPTARDPSPPAAPPEPEIGPRLLIQTNDGTLISRFMSSVRRVTVENGQIVVVGKDGKVDRIRLVNVVKMSIEP